MKWIQWLSEARRQRVCTQPIEVAGAPLNQATAAVLLLHGRGGTAQDMLALAAEREHPGVAFELNVVQSMVHRLASPTRGQDRAGA